jgi:hypothetical protein
MNEAILTRLKTVIERAVRPIRASVTWKLKRREELLAHVSAVFEEEAARLADENLALERTEQRFGSPTELTLELQASVPPNDRVTAFLEEAIGTTHALSWRHAVGGALIALLPGAAAFAGILVHGRTWEWPIGAGMIVFAFAWLMLTAAGRDALFGPRGRSWLKVAICGAASWALIPCFTFALCLTFTGDWRSSLADGALLLPVGLVAPAVLACFSCALAVNLRARLEWESLQID